MHRSGTSLLTRGLEALGVSLGNRLLPVAEDNPKGFWEDLDINALNVALLQALGHDWHTFTPILASELALPLVTKFKLRALEILRERLSGMDCFGIKDPRIPRLLPFWQDVFAHLQVEVSYIVVCRNPMSVARSLAKRNGFDLEKGYYLWLEHTLQSLVGTEHRKRIVTDYDRFLENPVVELGRIAQGLSLTLNASDPRVPEFTTSFLDGALRHNHYQVEDLAMDNALPPEVAILYQALLRLAAQPPDYYDHQVASIIERIRAQHQEDYSALRYMENCDNRITTFARQVTELANTVTAQETTILNLQNEVSKLNFQLAMVYASRSWKAARLASKIFLSFKRPFASFPSSSKADPI